MQQASAEHSVDSWRKRERASSASDTSSLEPNKQVCAPVLCGASTCRSRNCRALTGTRAGAGGGLSEQLRGSEPQPAGQPLRSPKGSRQSWPLPATLGAHACPICEVGLTCYLACSLHTPQSTNGCGHNVSTLLPHRARACPVTILSALEPLSDAWILASKSLLQQRSPATRRPPMQSPSTDVALPALLCAHPALSKAAPASREAASKTKAIAGAVLIPPCC